MQDVRYPLPTAYCVARPAFAVFFPVDVAALDGRPLMENRTLEYVHLRTPMSACSYPDYRAQSGLPINTGALHAFNRCGGETRSLIRQLGQAVGRGSADLGGLWKLARLSIAGPARQALRQVVDRAEGASIPAADAALLKMCRGLRDVVERMCAEGFLPQRTWVPEDILDFVDHRQLLLGRAEACAAPRVLIMRVLRDIHEALEQPAEQAPATDGMKFAALYSLMERFCFVYATARCAVLVREGLDKGAARPRTTFTRALEAGALAEGEIDQLQRELDQLLMLNFSCTCPDLEARLQHVVQIVPSLLSGLLPWSAFFDECFGAFFDINSRLSGLSIFVASPIPLRPRDIDVFFGFQPHTTRSTV
jgi:hypothetical protein